MGNDGNVRNIGDSFRSRTHSARSAGIGRRRRFQRRKSHAVRRAGIFLGHLCIFKIERFFSTPCNLLPFLHPYDIRDNFCIFAVECIFSFSQQRRHNMTSLQRINETIDYEATTYTLRDAFGAAVCGAVPIAWAKKLFRITVGGV